MRQTPTSAAHAGYAHGSAYAYRPALDGVRALAVTAVLVFHGGVAWLPGGFLGVDAFFVLSGFLITSLLLVEHAGRGRIRLGAFWLRRARRLLPALLVVLLAVVVAFRDLLAAAELAMLRTDALAALAYVANWRMIYRGDDYFARESAPSPLQHTWSLGIEEQFYLLWPLIVVGLLALGPRWRRRGAVLALCLAGAAASAICAALLFDPLAINRAYFGTDARAQALLTGCALGVLLSWWGEDRGRRPGWVVDGAANAALVGVVAIGWLWLNADGTDPWLYRGGFTLGALAVAAVIAHAVLSPGAVVARVLSLLPLVWIGKISYGLYLWHWPLFQLLNAERTGIAGPGLLALRLAATLAVSVVSYILIEQPVRTGRWPLSGYRMPWPRARIPLGLNRPIALPRLSPLVAGLGATAALGATGAFIVVGTTPPDIGAVTPVISVPTAAPDRTVGDPQPPVMRAGRKAGIEPRITFLGDSVSWSLGFYLPRQRGLSVTVRSIQGCGIARLPDLVQLGLPHTNYPACPAWDRRWRRAVAEDDPDVAVILLDRWELMDRRLGEVYRHVGQPEYDLYLSMELELAISIAGSRGAHVMLLTAPYNRRAERPDGGLYDEDLPERVDAWNRLQRLVAARHPDRVSVIDLNARMCPDGVFTWTIDGLRVRSDGLHFTPDGVRRWVAPWLVPQLAALAVGASPSSAGGD